MDREKLFDDFLTQCKSSEKICGQGNPNADILIIGKEPYCKKVIDPMTDRQDYLDYLNRNYEHCRVNCFVRKTCKNLDYYKQKYQDYDVVQKSFQELSSTWKNYQKLLYKIYERSEYHEEDKNIIDFERLAYTTELSSMPRPQADYDAAKGMINKRLLFFKESEFIQSFPVIILACREYIHNNDDDRQIDNTFHVKYDGDETGKHDIGSGFWFYTHHSDDGSKKQLVIHTRQFSHLYNNDKDFIVGIAGVVRKHLRIE